MVGETQQGISAKQLLMDLLNKTRRFLLNNILSEVPEMISTLSLRSKLVLTAERRLTSWCEFLAEEELGSNEAIEEDVIDDVVVAVENGLKLNLLTLTQI